MTSICLSRKATSDKILLNLSQDEDTQTNDVDWRLPGLRPLEREWSLCLFANMEGKDARQIGLRLGPRVGVTSAKCWLSVLC